MHTLTCCNEKGYDTVTMVHLTVQGMLFLEHTSLVEITIILLRFPAHDELGTCGTSLVFPKQSVLRISIRSTNPTSLTIMQSNIIETRPGATSWTEPLDLTK